MSNRPLRRWALTTLLFSIGALAVSSPSASAATNEHCNSVTSAWAQCPAWPTGARHTYYNARTSWTDTVNYDCAVKVHAASHVAYTNNNSTNTKYYAWACGYVNNGFPNNTELLRNYSWWGDSGAGRWIIGRGGW